MEGTSSASSSESSYESSSESESATLPSTAEEIQLQEVLCSSSTTLSTRVEKQVIQVDVDDEGDVPLRILKGKQRKTDESSHVYCGICMDIKPREKMFRNQNCSHIFCNDCIRRHVAAKIEENIPVVECPDPSCKGVIEPQHCRSSIPEELFDRWGNALCENLVLEAERFYCPFKDCSAMMIYDAKEIVTASECPHCNRLFCAQCKVPWHAEKDCEKFQKLEGSKREREDQMVIELAKTKLWRRCPKCSFYVERIEGCSRISCRCGNQFCYDCGSSWNSNKHYSCRRL